MNGSGKSTLLKTILGMIRPQTGRVQVAGGTPAAARKRGLIASVPQREDVDWAFPVSVRDLALMGRSGHLGPTRRARAAERAAVGGASDRVELAPPAARHTGPTR